MVQKRSIALYIVLSVITCGIFGFAWLVMITNDIKKLTGDQNATSGGVCLLLTIVTCGIYGLYWAYKMGDNLDQVKKARNIDQATAVCFI